MDELSKALKFYFWGCILYPVSLNIIGFISPLYAIYFYPDEPASHVLDLLEPSLNILPVFSTLFIAGTYYLTKYQQIVGKFFTWIITIMAVFIHLSYFLELEVAPSGEMLSDDSGVIDIFLLVIILYTTIKTISASKRVENVA